MKCHSGDKIGTRMGQEGSLRPQGKKVNRRRDRRITKDKLSQLLALFRALLLVYVYLLVIFDNMMLLILST